ncbi:MAG: carboxymuconolactone decarboxylase family protein [Pseudonocardiales bacterium]
MARISLDPPRTLTYRLGEWYSRRKFGAALDPARAMAHNPRVMRTSARAEMSLMRWNRLPSDLQHLAVLAAATRVGCAWCMDFGYWLTTAEGLAPAKVRDIPRWRDSDAYSDLERRVIAFAEAASATPPEVTDEMVEQLREDLDDAQLVELAMMVAVENQRARFNTALGLTSQGFKERCELANN